MDSIEDQVRDELARGARKVIDDVMLANGFTPEEIQAHVEKCLRTIYINGVPVLE